MSRKRARFIGMFLAAGIAVTAVAIPAGAGATTVPRVHPRPGPIHAEILPPLGQVPAGLSAAPASAATATSAPAPVTSPLTPSQCQKLFNEPCYDAGDLRGIYGLDSLPDEGRGAGVGLIMPYHNPVLLHDLDVYTSQAGLPAPDLHVISVGHPVTASPKKWVQTDAEIEEELDAEMILAMAPRVRLDLVETQEDFTLSPDAFTYAAGVLDMLTTQRPRIDAANFSLGYGEGNYTEQAKNTAAGNAEIRQQAADVNAAVRAGITVMASSGDSGATNYNLAGTALYPHRSVLFPASDPLITAVSGTQVYADDSGTRTQPDAVWTDDGNNKNGATGGGLSAVFSRPYWQAPYAALTGDHRGVGDVSMVGASETPVWFYTSEFTIPGEPPGWELVAGTSVSSPMFTGLIADAAALAGHPLGNINPALYTMARNPAANGIQPVTSGCNDDYDVTGYCAGPGPYEIPGGIGTVGDAAQFVPALAAVTSR